MNLNGIDIKWIVSPEEMTRGYAIYKFVIFEDDAILFCEVDSQHRDLQRVYGKKPLSAGKIVVSFDGQDKRFNLTEIGSMTLGLRGSWADILPIETKLKGFVYDDQLYS